MNRVVIAIDGPAGAGKSTISKIIAKKLNLEFIDTGAMYRAVTLKVLEDKIDLNNDSQLKTLLDNTEVSFVDNRILLDGRDVSREIRLPEVTERVSEVAAKSEVRKKLVELQRKMGQNTNVIMDGRDIGTCVLTDANFKIFLTASVAERAERRYLELVSKGTQVEYENICREIEERDLKDSSREISPLKKAEDAIVVNTTGKNIDEVVDEILGIINKAGSVNNAI